MKRFPHPNFPIPISLCHVCTACSMDGESDGMDGWPLGNRSSRDRSQREHACTFKQQAGSLPATTSRIYLLTHVAQQQVNHNNGPPLVYRSIFFRIK